MRPIGVFDFENKQKEVVINYKKGDETFPKIEDLTIDKWDGYLFGEIYSKAISLIKDIIKLNVIDRKNTTSRKYITKNNIVAFIGERGSGKTSCLQTVYYNLHNVISDDDFNGNINNKLPIIDPSYFDESSNILEIVVAQMFKEFKKVLSDSNQYVLANSKKYIEKKRELITLFQKVKETLECIKSPDNIYTTIDSIESLSRMSSSSDLEENMHELIKCYLDFFRLISSDQDVKENNTVMVIAIDDLDVQVKHTYKMVEQIRKYLIQDNVVILLGVKLKQLSDLIKQNYYNDYKALLDKEHMSLSQIEDMASRYLLKLIPFSHRLNLPNLYESSADVRLNIIDEEINYNNVDNSIYDNVLELIYSKTNMAFYNSLDQESLIVPNNLRELLNLVAMLCELEDLHKPFYVENFDSVDQRIISNRRIFKRYFIDTWCLDKLSTKHYLFIKELVDYDITQFNKCIVGFVYNEYKKFFDEATSIDKNMYSQHNRSYNISIADVQSMLDTLSTHNDVMVKRFIFAIKTIYSMFLYDEFHKMKSINSIRTCADALFNRVINIQEKAWKANNKLVHISDYERLIGGNILNIYRKSLEKGKLNKEAYIGTIDGSLLYEIYKRVINNEFLVHELNTLEFFLLTILTEDVEAKYRTSRRCYHEMFPLGEFPQHDIIMSLLSIPTNIFRYYRLYQLHSYIKNRKSNIEYRESVIYKFFEVIECNNENSLLYSILHMDVKNQFNEVFVNKQIEDISITNIEVIDILENAIGFTGKERASANEMNKLKKQNEKDKIINNKIKRIEEINIEIVRKFIEKLSTFQYYIYEFNNEESKYWYDRNELKYKKFVTPLQKILDMILELFNNSTFVNEFNKIYHYYGSNEE